MARLLDNRCSVVPKCSVSLVVASRKNMENAITSLLRVALCGCRWSGRRARLMDW
jgi:hypothetical protein